jgi:hypothetical protein
MTGDMGERQTGTGLRITPGSSAHLTSETQTPKEVKVEEVKIEAKDVDVNANTNVREGSEIRKRKGLNNIVVLSGTVPKHLRLSKHNTLLHCYSYPCVVYDLLSLPLL